MFDPGCNPQDVSFPKEFIKSFLESPGVRGWLIKTWFDFLRGYMSG
jgi:hypothetical protein